MVKCADCGLLEYSGGLPTCVHFRQGVPNQDAHAEGVCLWHCEIIYEDGQRLSALQHLLIDEAQRRSRKMRGPV